jgi:transcriptional regulator with XRE-family HTH domain
MTDLNALFERYGVSDEALEKQLGVGAEAIRLWRRGKRRLSPSRAIEVEQKFGIPRHVTRPDLWEQPTPDKDAA